MSSSGTYRAVPTRYDCKKGDFLDGKYMVESQLGEGAFGVVFKVSDRNRNPFAVKLLRLWEVPAEIRQPLIDRFEMEFSTGRISSPYLVHSTDYGYLNGNPYIVMEFCSGGDLGARKGRPVSELNVYLLHVLLGLRALHQNGKVHRDLKPENVLIKADSVAALTDFGISGDRNNRMTRRNILGKPDQMFGTYAYMPPEQVNRARGNSTVLPTTDIFSFGVMAYQMITGVLPFGKLDDPADLVQYQRRGKAGDWDKYRLSSIPGAAMWKSVIESCLEPDYRMRTQSVDPMISYLSQYAGTSVPASCGNGADVSGQSRPYNHNSCYRGFVPGAPQVASQSVSGNGGRTLLRVMEGEDYGKTFILDAITDTSGKKLVTCGRETDNMIILREYSDVYASRHHFTLEKNTAGDWFVRDGQWNGIDMCWKLSTNGTYVNSSPVTREGMKLSSGDIITAGDVKFRFER